MFETMIFDRLLALGIASHEILRIRIPDGRVERLYDGTGRAPDGIVMIGDSVYWTTMGASMRDPDIPGEAGRDYGAANGGVHAIDRDGNNRRDLTGRGSVVTGKQLAFDGVDRLYWGDREGLRVSSVRLDGTDRRDEVINAPASDRMSECVGVAVDASAGHLYWTQKGPSKGGRGRIFRAGLSVPDGESANRRTDIEVLWEGLPEPIDLEIHDGDLYWTDRGAPPLGNTLNRAPLPAIGQSGRTPEILADGFREAVGLAVDSEAVYVSDLSGRVRRIGRDGSDRLLAHFDGPITGICGLESRA